MDESCHANLIPFRKDLRVHRWKEAMAGKLVEHSTGGKASNLILLLRGIPSFLRESNEDDDHMRTGRSSGSAANPKQ